MFSDGNISSPSLVSHASLEFNFVSVPEKSGHTRERASQGGTDKEGIGMTKRILAMADFADSVAAAVAVHRALSLSFGRSAAMQLQNFLPRLHHYPLPECLRFMYS